MPKHTLKACAHLGCPHIQTDTRCPQHRKQQAAHYKATTPTNTGLTWTERQRRKTFVNNHRNTYGEWCPGYKRPAHTLTPADGPLTADHITAVANSGTQTGPLQTLCTSCNSRKGDRHA